MIATMAVLTYYVSIMGMTVYYFIASFQKNLPWANCDETWAGEGNCINGSTNSNQSVPEMYFLYVINFAEFLLFIEIRHFGTKSVIQLTDMLIL